jgi:hypothetical protein
MDMGVLFQFAQSLILFLAQPDVTVRLVRHTPLLLIFKVVVLSFLAVTLL